MRVVIGAVLIAVMGCVFTLVTVVIFVTQHLFASVVLGGLLAAPVVAAVRRRKTRRSQPGRGYPAAIVGLQPPPVSQWGAPEMSSAVSPCRCMSTLPGRSLP